ncbi:MAG: hypothetical protein M3R44_06980 [Candidatus Eremiobacteraeota bacterium]|nr:hypothetical protein [Candidatus Eremiobacteraeota bacterium]
MPAAPAAAITLLALVVAQLAVPSWGGFHSWEYAAALVALMALFIRGRAGGRRDRVQALGSVPIVAAIGVLVIAAAGLAVGLLGPDAEILQRVPGTVAVVPSAAGAAFFPAVDAKGIARGDAVVVIRQRAGSPRLLVPGARAYVGATALETVPRIAAYVDVRGLRDEHLTVTQPTNPSFLSPVALFSQTVPLAGRDVPADSFAVPARRRTLKIFYFAAGALPDMHGRGLGPGPFVLFAVDDESGALLPGGIAAAGSGRTITLAGLRLRATLGTYPALRVSPIPAPLALWAGLAALLLGFAGSKRPSGGHTRSRKNPRCRIRAEVGGAVAD